MRLGICVGPDKINLAAQLGFDYIECGMASIAAMSDADYEALLAKKPSFPIPILKCNGFLPGDVKVTGDKVNVEQQKAYLEKALCRAHALGVEVIVFGSGAARGVPEGCDFVKAWQQIADFLKLVEVYAAKYEIKIAIEPLRFKECNIVNYVSEGTVLAALVDLPHIGVLGDTFHMLSGAEPYTHLTYAGEKLFHIHISHELPDMSGRIYPFEGDGSDYETPLKVLKEMGYKGDVSIEAGCSDFLTDGKKAIECLRKYF